MKLKTALFTAACVLNVAASNARVNIEPASRPSPSTASADPVTGFGQCRAFFPMSQPPRVPATVAQQPRELCYESFAVLHSGRSRTPVYVVEKLTREQLLDAQDEQRAQRFFADARLPRAERATLDDYKDSGFDRGHMQYPVDFVLNIGFASEGVLSRFTQSVYSLPAPSTRA